MIYKKLTLVFLVILFLFSFFTVSFASDTETIPDGFIELDCNGTQAKYENLIVPDFSDLVNPYVGLYIICETSGKYCLFLLKDVNKSITTSGYPMHVKFYDDKGNLTDVPIYVYDPNSDVTDWSFFGSDNHVYGMDDEQLVWRTNIYNPDGTTFFFTTAQESPLAKVVKEAETQETLAQIVAILPLILVTVVCFLGLRKGLQTLSLLLKRA